MLTVHDIEEYPLSKATIGGYKCEEVDAFLDMVAADYQKLYDENLTLTKKLNLLAEKLTEYRKDEDYLKNALVDARRIVDEATAEAKGKADEIIAEATAKSEEMLQTVLRKANEADKHYEQMRVEVNNFRNQLLNTYKSHIEIISALPVYEREEQEEAAVAVAEEAPAPAPKEEPAPVKETPVEEEAPAVEDVAAVSIEFEADEAAEAPAAE